MGKQLESPNIIDVAVAQENPDDSQCKASVSQLVDSWVSYDFTNAHLGDKGVICVLQALVDDWRCVKLSLRGCNLKSGSAQAVAAFLELQPHLTHADLSENFFSYEAGKEILEALVRRSCGKSTDGLMVGLEGDKTGNALPRLGKVTVDLGRTALAWDRGGVTVGPPCGTKWAASD